MSRTYEKTLKQLEDNSYIEKGPSFLEAVFGKFVAIFPQHYHL